jgi:hypothetical protein
MPEPNAPLIPLEELAENLRPFCDPSRPLAARKMAAQGLVPLKGDKLITVLAVLSADSDGDVQKAATKTLSGLPDAILLPACEADLHPAVLNRLVELHKSKQEVLIRVAANPATPDATVERLAREGNELLCERIALNERRLLGAPVIIEALYRNRNTRMSTADRLVELAIRNKVDLPGIHGFKAHAEALMNQLIPEPTEEPLPSDALFKEALERDSDEIAVKYDEKQDEEKVKEHFLPLVMQIKQMTVAEKIRFAYIANAAARAILVRDPMPMVALTAVASHNMTANEAVEIAKSRDVRADVLRVIGKRKEWMKTHELKRAIVFNPRTPLGIALQYVRHLILPDLKALARSRNIPNEIRAVAFKLATERVKRGE